MGSGRGGIPLEIREMWHRRLYRTGLNEQIYREKKEGGPRGAERRSTRGGDRIRNQLPAGIDDDKAKASAGA